MTTIDASALAQARERLELSYRWPETPICSSVCRADLRLVLDALRDARRQAFEEVATYFKGLGWSRPLGGFDAAQLVEILAAKEQQP